MANSTRKGKESIIIVAIEKNKVSKSPGENAGIGSCRSRHLSERKSSKGRPLFMPLTTAMAPKTSVPTAHAELPHELYRDIIENLRHLRERDTLLCLALVSKAWCAESQRMLYRTVCDDSTDLDQRESLLHTHTLFLKTIILNPSRLGPYVQAYKQRELICHPFLAPYSKAPYMGASSYLWDLTAQALPALINLKHLFIVPLFDDYRTPQASLLEGCTFKLDSLRWGFHSSGHTRTCPFVEFLRTQQDLVHLEVGFLPAKWDLSWLPDDRDFCPNLTSASCQISSAGHVTTKRRNVTALKIWNNGSPFQPVAQRDVSALCRLQYLSIPMHLISALGTIELNLILLELATWNVSMVESLPGLPKLRVLVFSRENDIHGYRAIDVKEEYNLRIQLTVESFRRCPNLEYVVVEDIRRGEGPLRRYRKMSISGSNGGRDTTPDIQSEEFFIEREFGMPWWTAYGV